MNRTKLIFLLLSFPVFLLAQDGYESARSDHLEVTDDPYVQVDKSLMPRQESYKIRAVNYYTTQVNVDGQGNDIIGDAANEPSLAVDPTNPDRIVVGWRQFDVISSNFRQAGFGFSLDAGLNFTNTGIIDSGNFRSDPVLDFDKEGNFYYNSLQSTFECDIWISGDEEGTWNFPVPAFGGDKQWMQIDRTDGPSAGNNYTYWYQFAGACRDGNFSRSTNNSMSFEQCSLIEETPFWGTMVVDKQGTLYLIGRNSEQTIKLFRSTNAKDETQAVIWDQITEVDLGGPLGAFQNINPGGLSGHIWVDVDISDGPGENNIYALASVEGEEDPLDVMFVKSTDGGLTFESPLRINNDAIGNYNWFGTLAVAPNGRIDVCWLNSLGPSTATRDSRLLYTFSEDQGNSWSGIQILSDYFDPSVGYPNQPKLGDYIDMVSDDNYAHIAWAGTFNGGQDVYYTRVTPVFLNVDEFTDLNLNVTISPNPISEKTTIEFQAFGQTEVKVHDLYGRSVLTLFKGELNGNQRLNWETELDGSNILSSGLYFISVQSGSKKAYLKAVLH